MVSKTTRYRQRKLDKELCGYALDDLNKEDLRSLINAPHPKLPDSDLSALDYAIWLSSKGYMGGLYNLFKQLNCTLPPV